jgi:hypothetical protein
MFNPITESEARGDSAAMSEIDLAILAGRGEGILAVAKLDAIASGWRSNGISQDIIMSAWFATREPWGGVTIDLRTVQAVSRTSGWAVTTGNTVSLPDTTGPVEFADAILSLARNVPAGQYLGVFHDSDKHAVEFDSVFIAETAEDAIAVGVARHATGGAYDFATGNALWMPHLAAE